MTFAEVADAVGGVKRLVHDVYVGHEDETVDAHPYFDMHAATADRDVDIALNAGGYETPLSSMTDPKLRNAWLGIVIGYLSQASSDREEWMKALEAAGIAFLARIANREDGITVIGAIEADETVDASGAIFGQQDGSRLFALDDPWSSVNTVYENLGPGPRKRW
jgi:hypothetical protein